MIQCSLLPGHPSSAYLRATLPVLALGGLTIDWLWTASGRSGPALGGNAAYAAVGAWLAGSAAEVVSVVGDDYPAQLLDQLTSSGASERSKINRLRLMSSLTN